ncbi:MAG TPA: hypothetical protein VI796_03640, partial [Candidatus Thermoplasmatota archaeon]|nr:hypothetical protein [Candidatus Thermoplasmatota archaeon]
AFFTPPGTVEPEVQAEADVPEAAANTLNATDEFAGEALDALQDVVDDPGSAPSQVERIVAAALRFVQRVAGIVGEAVDAVAAAVVAAAQAVLDALGLGLDLGVSAVQGLGHAIADVADLLAGGFSDAVSAIASGLEVAARSGLTGLQDAAGAVADGLDAAVEGVQDAVHGIADAISGWFGDDEATERSGRDRGLADGLGVEAPDTGLVDGVLDTIA